ncbi:energy-coupling factor transporter transmembrane component T family protein [Paenibacillus massiliensis]|uniref:energy-coupling factor transporter transmembrane component T family protein n=1 Tax=Paenibacillus massiliensis TaxID=225917 RepID=UPI00036BD90F|nr:energy-coupling factor transporter transmembrane component T [Paenibacillus massiliensis]
MTVPRSMNRAGSFNSGNTVAPRRALIRLEMLNPSMKALTVTLCVLFLSFAFDPVTPFVALVFTVAVTWLAGDISWRRWLLLFTPFVIMGLGYIWTAALFPREDTVLLSPVLLSIGPLEITEAVWHTALSLGLRTLIFSALSLLFILTTDPVHFILSLMQQCKLPPKLAYGILAGFRFLPLFREELRIMQQAHRMRGVGKERGWGKLLRAVKRYSIPLLASAIRKSERVAVAMISRGFTGEAHREFYVQWRITKADWCFLLLMLGGVAVSYALAALFGTLEWYRGQL